MQTCLICGYENKPDSLECSQCGASLEGSIPTPIMLTPMNEGVINDAKQQLLKQPASARVTLHIAGEHQPILINETGRIILGRNILSEDKPKINLNKFDGHSLGVSREHAALTITDETCTLEDLGSTNGTWVNESRLRANQQYSLRNGDLIRLGFLLMIVLFDK